MGGFCFCGKVLPKYVSFVSFYDISKSTEVTYRVNNLVTDHVTNHVNVMFSSH